MSDWLRTKDRYDPDWKQNGYQAANEAQKNIRMELAKDDTDKLVEKMGEYNAQRFLSSGVAGIPPSQTYNVKESPHLYVLSCEFKHKVTGI